MTGPDDAKRRRSMQMAILAAAALTAGTVITASPCEPEIDPRPRTAGTDPYSRKKTRRGKTA